MAQAVPWPVKRTSGSRVRFPIRKTLFSDATMRSQRLPLVPRPLFRPRRRRPRLQVRPHPGRKSRRSPIPVGCQMGTRDPARPVGAGPSRRPAGVETDRARADLEQPDWRTQDHAQHDAPILDGHARPRDVPLRADPHGRGGDPPEEPRAAPSAAGAGRLHARDRDAPEATVGAGEGLLPFRRLLRPSFPDPRDDPRPDRAGAPSWRLRRRWCCG